MLNEPLIKMCGIFLFFVYQPSVFVIIELKIKLFWYHKTFEKVQLNSLEV